MSEPVEYQYRTRPDWIPEWNGWNTCSKESAQAYEKTPYLHDWHYEVRRLYITPPHRTRVGLTDEDDIDWEDGGNLKDLVKAIEAKLKQKNT
jgi:hypothetical protein